jgi:hypothetical protein
MTKQWIGDDGLWDTELYQRYKKENFEILDKWQNKLESLSVYNMYMLIYFHPLYV